MPILAAATTSGTTKWRDRSVHVLKFGSLVLSAGLSTETHGQDGDAWTYDVGGDETDFGTPEAVTTAVESFLTDGGLEQWERAGNREMSFLVLIDATTHTALALAEAQLAAELQRENRLTWLPPDGSAPTTVFRVLWSTASHEFDHNDEMRVQRAYRLTLRCYPYGMSATRVTTVREPDDGVAAITTVVDDLTSTTGWTTSSTDDFANVQLALDGDSDGLVLTGDYTADGTSGALRLDRTLTVDVSSDKYLVTITEMNPSTYSTAATGRTLLAWDAADTLYVPNLVASKVLASGLLRQVWQVSADLDTIERFRLVFGWNSGDLTDGQSVACRLDEDLWTADSSNIDGDAGIHQLAAIINTVGSVRTSDAIIKVESESGSNLGDHAMVYTSTTLADSTYTPACSPYSTASRSTDAAAMSGTSESFDDTGSAVFDVPLSSLPEGRYMVVISADVDTPGTTTLTVDAQLSLPTVGAVGSVQSVSAEATAVGPYQFVTFGAIGLPPTESDDPDAVVQVTVTSSEVGTTVKLDEVYLFDLTNGELTIVDAPAHPALEVITPSLDHPLPRVMVSNADGSGRRSAAPGVHGWGSHEVEPPLSGLFVVTPNTTDARLTLDHRPMWLNYAAE